MRTLLVLANTLLLQSVVMLLSTNVNAVVCSDASSTDNRPQTIPAVREWKSSEDSFTLPARTRLLISPSDGTTTSDIAAVFAEDLIALPHNEVSEASIVAMPQSDPRSGDILLTLSPGRPELGSEWYEIKVGHSIEIAAATSAGLFYGTRTLLQLFHQTVTVSGGTIRDWPCYPERGMTIDIARKYFTPSWLERHVREIAYLKMNYLHLHISDNEGFGIQSIGHPEFKSETGQLTGQQVHDLIALAARYHVVVVPEIDMPGHMKAILKDNEKYQLKNIFGKNPAVLDIKNGEAVEFAKGIIAEYLDLFTGPYWHLGVDEVLVPGTYSLYPQLGGTKDAILDFVNDIDSFVQTHDIKNRKKLRVFNDQVGQGHSVRVNPDVVVDWWMDFSPLSEWAPLTPQQLIERGYHIMNCGWWPTYYVSGDIIRPPNPDMKSAYETWSLNQFRGMTYLSGRVKFLPTRTISVDSPYNLGSTLNVWNDYDWNNQPNSKTEDEIAEAIFKPLRVVAQKTWESKPLTDSYDEFQTIIDAVGHAPKY